MSNMNLLNLLGTSNAIHLEMQQKYEAALLSGTKKDYEIAKSECAKGNGYIRETIQKSCTHPVGVKVGLKVYCPICEKELPPESVITIEKEAGGHNIGFIREKIAEVLPLIPEVTPAQIAEYVDEELKTFSR